MNTIKKCQWYLDRQNKTHYEEPIRELFLEVTGLLSSGNTTEEAEVYRSFLRWAAQYLGDLSIYFE